MLDGTMYIITPLARVIAFDATSGRERWTYDGRLDHALHFGDHASRGVSLYTDSSRPLDSSCRRRVVAATVDARLLSLDAKTGRPCADFGIVGTVDLRAGLRNAPRFTGEYAETSPPAVIGNVIVVGSAIADNGRRGLAPADSAACVARIVGLRNDGPFTPPSVEGSLVRPSNIGGAHWGGIAIARARRSRWSQ